MRLVEIRLLDGPNVYRLEPTVKIEVTVGRRRTWYGERSPGRHAVVRLGAPVPARDAPSPVVGLVESVRHLHRRARLGRVPVTIHRTSEPGHWIVCFPWREHERAELIATAAFRLATDGGERYLERALRRIADAGTTPPEWIDDAARRIPVISISGTNGKSTTTRMISHILTTAGRTVGSTTTDGVIVDGRLVEEGDYTGPLGAWAVMSRPEVDVAVLETARGGILLRGLGYESNDASVLTNISSDHLDLQGVHTLPELAEVKSVIARVTRAEGTAVLNADDPLVAAVASRVRARVALFSLRARSPRVRRHLERGGSAYFVDGDAMIEADGSSRSRVAHLGDVPATFGGVARHNVANALAAAAGARAMGATPAHVAAGLADFRPTSDRMPGRLNVYRREKSLVIVDFAHNEAGLEAVFDMAEALVGRTGRRTATVSAIVGTGGDRPDDTLRALGRMAATRADRLAIKETRRYLRGRTVQSMVGELLAGMVDGGARRADVRVYEKEPDAVRGELTAAEVRAPGDTGRPELLVVMCHEDRPGVERVLTDLGFVAVADPAELSEFRAAR